MFAKYQGLNSECVGRNEQWVCGSVVECAGRNEQSEYGGTEEEKTPFQRLL
jgi:hypothetical protein